MTTEPKQSLIEKEIDGLYQKARLGEKRGKLIALMRRVVAYLLKGVAAGGSLVVATGNVPQWNQSIGVAILIAVLLDGVSSNHKRLLSEVQAGYAYEFLRERTSREYNRSLDPILKRIQKSGVGSKAAQAADAEIDVLQQKAHKELTDGLREIRKSLADADLKALEALALDNERAAVKQSA